MWRVPGRRAGGFTIIEMAIVMLVLAVLLRLGAPSFATWIANQRLRTSAESILHGLNLARGEALRRNARVLFQMPDAEGRSNWTICAVLPASVDCDPDAPPIFVRDGGEESGRTRIGASTDAAALVDDAFATALAPAAGMPAAVMFDGLGRMVNQVGWLNTLRFDARDTAIPEDDERRLVVAVSVNGAARMCDPRVAAGNPRAC